MSRSNTEILKINVVKMFNIIGARVDAMIDAGDSDLDPQDIEDAIALVEEIDEDELMEGFCNSHEHWPKIKKRDTTFITEGLSELLGGMDVSPLVEILRVNEELNKSQPKADQSNWSVPDRTINTLWNYFESFVESGCKHVKATGKPDINVDPYIVMFGLTL